MAQRIESWVDLNDALRQTTDEATCLKMLDAELQSANPRKVCALRIHSRYARLRAKREHDEIEGRFGG